MTAQGTENLATPPADWAEAVAAFADHLRREGRQAQPTRWQYAQHVRWLAASDLAGPWELQSRDLAAWLEGQGWSNETRRKVVVSLRAFYGWAVREQYLEWAPTAGLPRRAGRRPGPKARRVPPAWEGPLDEYVATLRAAARATSTIDQYRVHLRALAHAAADPWAVTSQQLAQWLSNPDWSPATKRAVRVAVAGFYRWAVKAGYLEVSPAADLDPVRVPRTLPRPAPDADLWEALQGADDRARLALMLAAYAGLRRAEIAALHATHVTPTHLVVPGKGGHQRVVPIDPAGDLASALHTELDRRRRGQRGTGWERCRFVSADGYLFPSNQHPGPMTPNHMGRILSAALPGKWTAHPLRHRFATAAYAADRDLMAVQQLLGHARPETTSVYAQVPDGALLSAVAGASRLRW